MIPVPLRVLANVLKAPLYPIHLAAKLKPHGAQWVHVKLRPRLSQMSGPLPPIARLIPELAMTQPTALESLRELAKLVIEDAALSGVVFEVPPLQAGWSKARGLRRIMQDLRDAGKEVVVYLPRGGGNLELYTAMAADRVYLGPEASFMALGLSSETRYLRPMLDKLGIRVESFARKEFKTAVETVEREEMSDAQREQVGALLHSLNEELLTAISARPGMNRERARAVFEAGFLRGQAAQEAGVADGVCYDDELGLRLAGRAETREPAKTIRAPEYMVRRQHGFFRPVRSKPYIGIVRVKGAIRDNDDEPRGITQTIAALRIAREDKHCAGVVLLINSPGGSALASDRIHREVTRVREEKPVVACFQDVAASGGYYIAAAADSIVAEPVTITGSIGVVSARLMARDLLDKVGIKTEVLRSAPHADMFSPARELDDAERAILDRELDAFYESFVKLVAKGRGRTFDEVEPLARGRVWSGADAAEQGLVDRLGGLEVALDEVRTRCKLPEKKKSALRPATISPRGLHAPPPAPPPTSATPVGFGTVATQLAGSAGMTQGGAVLTAAGAALGLVGRLAPELTEWAELLGGRDRVLMYAPGLPEIR